MSPLGGPIEMRRGRVLIMHSSLGGGARGKRQKQLWIGRSLEQPSPETLADVSGPSESLHTNHQTLNFNLFTLFTSKKSLNKVDCVEKSHETQNKGNQKIILLAPDDERHKPRPPNPIKHQRFAFIFASRTHLRCWREFLGMCFMF